MSQLFHVTLREGGKETRVPLRVDENGHPLEKYSSETKIHPRYETRQFLEPLGKYALVNVEDTAEAQRLLLDGYRHDDGSQWYVGSGFVRDDGATFVVLPEPTTDVEFFSKLGLKVELKKRTDSFKVGKYLKRLWSPGERSHFLQGDVVRQDGNVIQVRLKNGKLLAVRYVPAGGPLVDGMNLVSTHCLRCMGIKGKVGSGLQITALSPLGLSKGHAIVLKDLMFDLVLFNSKPQLVGEKFTFSFKELSVRKQVNTDVQSIVNFRMYQTSFMQKWSDAFMWQVLDAVQDEEKLRQMLAFHEIGFHKWERSDSIKGEVEGELVWKEKDWAFLRALRAGIDPTHIPALTRQASHLFLDKVMDCESKVRIPVPEEAGGARYALVDPTIFDRYGNADPKKGVLRGNTVYCTGHVGPVVFHRQPNAHRSEHHVADSVLSEALSVMDTGAFMFLSSDMLESTMLKLGGGDQDDRLVYYKDPEVVKHFQTLEPYPIDQVEKERQVDELPNRFRPFRPMVYDKTQIGAILAQQEQQHTSIGQAVNPMMMDTLITDQKEVILKDLHRKLAAQPGDLKFVAAIQWLEAYAGHVMSPVASGLECIIDSVKHTGGNVGRYADMIRKFWANLGVFPEFCLHGGFGDEGRLPQSRRDDPPVFVRTDVEDRLDEIKQARCEMEDRITELTWERLEPVPLEIQTYPTNPDDLDPDPASELAKYMQVYYSQKRKMYLGPLSEGNSKSMAKKRKGAFKAMDKETYDHFKDHPLVMQAIITLYGKIYSKRAFEVPKQDNGRPKPFPDGILWGGMMSGLTVKALDLCDLTCRFIPVDVDRKYLYGIHNVHVDKGVINLEGTPEQIGTADRVADGATKIEHGHVRIPSAKIVPYVAVPMSVFTVVAGHMERNSTQQEINKWKSHTWEKVKLIPYVYLNMELDQPEHAVGVHLIDEKGKVVGERFGNLSREDASYVTREIVGYLYPGQSAKTLSFYFEGLVRG